MSFSVEDLVWRYYVVPEYVEQYILKLVSKHEINVVDQLSRIIAYKVYDKVVKYLQPEKLLEITNLITGGLGWKEDSWDFERVVELGKAISWCDVVKNDFKVLEIGTGLGRTMYCVFQKCRPRIYMSIDISPLILAIALYRNLFSEFQEVLNEIEVKLILGNALRVINSLNEVFDHVIHDGGPNPHKNPKLYSDWFLETLTRRVRCGGTLSIFCGKDKTFCSKLIKKLVSLGLNCHFENVFQVQVIHCFKYC